MFDVDGAYQQLTQISKKDYFDIIRLTVRSSDIFVFPEKRSLVPRTRFPVTGREVVLRTETDTCPSISYVGGYHTTSMPSQEPCQSVSDKNLLVLSHRYNTFTKSQIDELARYYDHIYVLVRHNLLAELAAKVDSNTYNTLTYSRRVVPETPRNVTVETTNLIYLPLKTVYRNLDWYHSTVVLKQLRKIELEFDIVHAHFTWTAGAAGVAVAEELDVPCVLTAHEDTNRLLSELRSDRPVEDVWERASAIIRVNEQDVDILREYCDDVRYVPNGFDRDRFPDLKRDEARSELGIPLETPVIYSLGHLNERKGHVDLIAAVDRMERDAMCVISGEGELKSRLQERITERDLDDQVLLTDYVSDTVAALWMNACDVFVLPSYAEGTPTVLFEALGCGKPYVGTDVGGVDEIITSSDYGLLYEPGDVSSLATLLDEAIGIEWSEDQIKSYASNFDWETISKDILAVHEDVLSRHSDSMPKDRQETDQSI